MDILQTIKKLARSDKYQILYNQSQKMGNIKIFGNDMDFTFAQLFFMNWLSTYSSLYEDIAMGEDHISEKVIKDDLRTEAYLLYRKEKYNDDKKTKKTEQEDTNIPGIKFY